MAYRVWSTEAKNAIKSFPLYPIPYTLYALSFPFVAHAQVLTRVVELFNIFVGLLLTASILTFATGFVVWITRLGTWPTYRTEGVKIMEWAVVQLFVLVVLLMIVQLFRDHPDWGARLVALIVIVGIIIIVLSFAKEKKPEKPPPTRR